MMRAIEDVAVTREPEISLDELHDHMRKLLALGMLVAICGENGTYFAITDKGQAFLDGGAL